ncbi:MAG: hypothetical protein GY913_00270 [Proteobacteria bacterium]|nr:hypothetical protein [Pseudomonadota bacterium]MCP4915332.1 hypothetical protein [Pseudomonadota bacterium]
MSALSFLLLPVAAWADEPLGTVSGLVDDRPWDWSVSLGGGAAIPIGPTASAWGPGPQLAGRLERSARNDVSVELLGASSGHTLVHAGRLVAGWDDEAPLLGTEQHTVARGGVRWARPGRVEPSIAIGLGAMWLHTRLGVSGADDELVQDLIWPNMALSGALLTRVHGPLFARLSLEASAVVGVDVGEVGPDSVFSVWTLGSQLEIVVRVPHR